MDNHGFFNILYTLAISTFGALAKEINDKSKTHESMSVFFGEIVLHGFSGWIFALAATSYLGLTEFNQITIAAGVGGLFGFDLLKIVMKVGLKLIASAKDIKLNDSDLNLDDKDNKKDKDNK